MAATETIASKNLIVELIIQDLRQHQFVYRLEEAGVVMEHMLDICPLVARLMGIAKGQISDEWMEVYTSFMYEARGCYKNDQQALYRLAVRCYSYLKAFGSIEKRVKGDT